MNYKRQRNARSTSEKEIKAVIGLLYFAGVFKSGRQNIYDLWNTDETGVDIFHAKMLLARFKFLLQCIRFDDIATRNERKESDKLVPIRKMFESFMVNCKKAYCVSPYVTVDEKLEPFRGRCGFEKYIPSKPAKYGTKIFAMVDASNFYTSNMEAYVGVPPEGPYKISNKPGDIVERMRNDIPGSGRNITIDNWFTSYELFYRMLNDHRCTVVGTLRKNKRKIPAAFSSGRGRDKYTSLFGFQEKCTLLSYVQKKNKLVLLLSSIYNDDKIDESKRDEKSPR